MQVVNNFHGSVEKVINADNFFEAKQLITEEKKTIISETVKEIINEKSKEGKESKWKKFIQEWLPSITEAGAKAIKELVFGS